MVSIGNTIAALALGKIHRQICAQQQDVHGVIGLRGGMADAGSHLQPGLEAGPIAAGDALADLFGQPQRGLGRHSG